MTLIAESNWESEACDWGSDFIKGVIKIIKYLPSWHPPAGSWSFHFTQTRFWKRTISLKQRRLLLYVLLPNHNCVKEMCSVVYILTNKWQWFEREIPGRPSGGKISQIKSVSPSTVVIMSNAANIQLITRIIYKGIDTPFSYDTNLYKHAEASNNLQTSDIFK